MYGSRVLAIRQPRCASPLDAVLANPAGRRLWGEFLENEFRGELTTPPSAGGQGDRSKYDGSTLRVGKTLSTGSMEKLLDAQDPPTEEATATPPSSQRQTVGIPPTASSKGEDADSQLVVVSGLRSTTLKETSRSEDASGLQIVESNQAERKEMSDSPATVALLHLALENVTRHKGKGRAGGLDITDCVQFCTEWPRDCLLPTFFDRALLQPAWSAAEQVNLGKWDYTTKRWVQYLLRNED